MPVRRWQRVQWHQPAPANGAETSKATAPHGQEPVITAPSLARARPRLGRERARAQQRARSRRARTGAPMLFAHGFGCDQNMWRFVAPAFEDDHRVVLFDHVGAGGSDLARLRPERHGTLDGYADDVVEICDELDLRDAVFVGHSVSAMIGVLAAAARARAASAGSCSSAPRRATSTTRATAAASAREDIDELLDSLDEQLPRLVERDGAGDHGQRRPARARRGADERASAARTRRSRRASPASRSCPTTAPTSRRCACRRSCCSAATTRSRPREVGAYVHAAIPGSPFVQLDATGHCPNLSAPRETDRGDPGVRLT